jgi:hypothetical protein
MPKRSRVLALLPVATLAIYACSSSDSPDPGGGAEPWAYGDVKYGPMLGGTSDEALDSLTTLLDTVPLKVDPSQAPTLTAPPAGVLSADPLPTFTWQVGAVTTRRSAEPEAPSVSRGAWAWATSTLEVDTPNSGCSLPCSRFDPLGLRALLGPLRVAHAHGPAFTGTGTLLTFASASNPKLLRIFSGRTSYAPTVEEFDALARAGSFTLHLVSAVFMNNRVVAEGGPFDGSTTEFSVGP